MSKRNKGDINPLQELMDSLDFKYTNDVMTLKGTEVEVGGNTFTPYRQGDENIRRDHLYFNPVSEEVIRGESPAMSVMRNRMGEKISVTLTGIILMTLKHMSKGSKLPTTLQFKTDKLVGRNTTDFKAIVKHIMESGINLININVDYNHKIKDKRYAVVAVLVNATVEYFLSDSSSEIKKDSVGLIKSAMTKLAKEGFMASSEEEYQTYDVVTKAYNTLVTKYNKLLNVLDALEEGKVPKILWLTSVPTAVDFKEHRLMLDRMPIFNDYLEIVEKLTTKNPGSTKKAVPKKVRSKPTRKETERRSASRVGSRTRREVYVEDEETTEQVDNSTRKTDAFGRLIGYDVTKTKYVDTPETKTRRRVFKTYADDDVTSLLIPDERPVRTRRRSRDDDRNYDSSRRGNRRRRRDDDDYKEAVERKTDAFGRYI